MPEIDLVIQSLRYVRENTMCTRPTSYQKPLQITLELEHITMK